MSDPAASLPSRGSDFDRLYDLDDPSPYFTSLIPCDYRMPIVVAGALKAIRGQVSAARDAGDRLRMLDFACGYGVVGALLRHALTMHEIRDRYGARQWRPDDARRHWEADAAFFAARRDETAMFEIGGVDIAGTALEYATAMGFVDRAFHENLVDRAPGDDLTRFLRGLDLVVESGSTGRPLPAAFARILDCGAGGRRPWFLYCPRPDVDWTALDRVWAEHGYRAESLCLRPVRYRKPLNAQEREEMLCGTRALGKPDHAVMRDGYLLVDMTLARPAADTGNPPIAELRWRDD